jgi:hypothetical protein
MKQLPALIMIACAISLVATNPIYVTGRLKIHGHEKRKCVFEIIVKGGAKIVAKATADTSGKFELSFTPADEKYFDFFYIDSHHANDTIYLKSYNEFESDKLEVTFYTFKGIVPVDDDDHVICPKCKKSDKVTAIETLPGYYYCSGDKIKF